MFKTNRVYSPIKKNKDKFLSSSKKEDGAKENAEDEEGEEKEEMEEEQEEQEQEQGG